MNILQNPIMFLQWNKIDIISCCRIFRCHVLTEKLTDVTRNLALIRLKISRSKKAILNKAIGKLQADTAKFITVFNAPANITVQENAASLWIQMPLVFNILKHGALNNKIKLIKVCPMQGRIDGCLKFRSGVRGMNLSFRQKRGRNIRSLFVLRMVRGKVNQKRMRKQKSFWNAVPRDLCILRKGRCIIHIFFIICFVTNMIHF